MKDIIRMNQLAGIITEGQAKKMLKALNENEVSNKYVVEDDGFYMIDPKKAFEYLKQFNNKEVSAKQFIKDDEGWGEFEQYLEDVEQMSDKELEDAMREEMSMYYFSKPDEI
jgi:hypothetical protein